MTSATKRVLVLGAGFGGLTFCQEFSHASASVTLVDRTNHHLFQPLLYQVAMAGLSAPDIAQPVRSILSHVPRLEVMMDEVQGIDLGQKRVQCKEKVFGYDYLVIALGSVTSYFGHSEWERWAPGMKTLDDALRIRRNVLLAFEQAENTDDVGGAKTADDYCRCGRRADRRGVGRRLRGAGASGVAPGF